MNFESFFPKTIRPRRLRISRAIRDLVAETDLLPQHLILPIFVKDTIERPIPSGGLENYLIYPTTGRHLINFINNAIDLGIRSFLIFGITEEKDEIGSRAFARDGPVQLAVKNIRKEIGWDPLIFTDLCICGYTTHGHCGLPKKSRRGKVIDNDSTLEIYAKIAISQAEAGADFVAPSGMMDNQVRAIREALDNDGFHDVGILAYSAKYASYFYGPFREVMRSAPRFGDRKSYQMDPRNVREALKEVLLDIEEGADMIMVKPALPYLDVIRLVKEHFPQVPLVAYSVSGEYAIIKEAAKAGLIDEKGAMLEILYSIKRAGADAIITYYALDAASILKGSLDIF